MSAPYTSESDWALHARMYAFLGNSLLSPMTTDTSCGLSPIFWDSFVHDGLSDHAIQGLAKLRAYAQAADNEALEDAVRNVSIEYVRLFIGPPKPLAPPWESMANGSSVGFGEPANSMLALLRKEGMTIDGPSNQYADHIGLELLYVSALCKRFSEKPPSFEAETDLRTFIAERLLSWIPGFYETVHEAAAGGYYVGIVELAWGLLVSEV